MVGCAQKDDFAQQRKPWALLLCGDMARTARNQPTHAVPHDDQFLQRNGPNGNQLVQRGAKVPSVSETCLPVLSVQVDRRVTQVFAQRLAMVVALARPLQIVHAQPMNQDQEFATGFSICWLIAA